VYFLKRGLQGIVPPVQGAARFDSQWVKEIRQDWPFFQAVIRYEDHEFRKIIALSSLLYSAMAELLLMETMPAELKFL